MSSIWIVLLPGLPCSRKRYHMLRCCFFHVVVVGQIWGNGVPPPPPKSKIVVRRCLIILIYLAELYLLPIQKILDLIDSYPAIMFVLHWSILQSLYHFDCLNLFH